MAHKILIITGDGGECYETLYAIHRLQEANFIPVLAAKTRKRLHLVIHDFEPGWDTYKERPGYEMEPAITFQEVVVAEYAAILLIGGRAPEYLRNDALVLNIVKQFNAQGKGLFAICHGIQILAAAGLVTGKKLTCYEHVRFEVERCGGVWINESAVVEGNLISAQTWQDHPAFYRQVIAYLEKA